MFLFLNTAVPFVYQRVPVSADVLIMTLVVLSMAGIKFVHAPTAVCFILLVEKPVFFMNAATKNTRWFKYDRDKL
jgi:hypothetical protein